MSFAAMAEVDDIVCELPVFLRKSGSPDLYLFQYPVRPANMPYDTAQFIRSRLKPLQKKIEIEMALNTCLYCYDQSKGEQLAYLTDGGSNEDSYFFNSELMDKHVLSSSNAIACSSRYVIGYFKDGELHLNPLQSIVQLRPTFSYIDRRDNKQKHESKSGGDADLIANENEDDQQITVKFAHPDNEKIRKSKENSFRFHQQALDEEPWMNVEFHSNDSVISLMKRKQLISHQFNGKEGMNIHFEAKYYLNSLVSDVIDPISEQRSSTLETLSLVELRNLSLDDQLKTILLNAKVIEFWQLVSLLPRCIEDSKILCSLKKCAQIVQGCWVLKSDLLYPKDAFSSHTGISSEILVRSRDFILWHFSQNHLVSRKEIAATTKVPSEDLQEMLEQIAVKTVNGWQFMLPKDTLFIHTYPLEAQESEKYWENRYQQLIKLIKGVRNSPEKIANHEVRSPRSRKRTKSQAESEVESTYSDNKNFSASALLPIEGLVKTEPSEGSIVGIDGVEHNMDPEVFSALRTFVREKLNTHWCFSISELRRLLVEKLEETPGHILNCAITDAILARVVELVGGSKLAIQWSKETKQEALYAVTQTGDAWDSWRAVFFDMFKSNSRYRKPTIRKRLEEETGAIVSEADLTRLLKDYCVSQRNGHYCLKGTVVSAL